MYLGVIVAGGAGGGQPAEALSPARMQPEMQ